MGAANKWRAIGKELGFNIDELDALVREPGLHDDEDYYTAMLRRWFDWAPPNNSTLSALVHVIRAVGMERVAYNFEQLQKTELTDKCKHFTIMIGQADVFDLEEYGLTISFKSDCLPPNLKKCEVFISADLTTDIPLPSRSLLVSGVYHITTIPFINQLNQPIEISMEHCANDLNNLCFVVAKDQNQQKFEYMEGGTFEIEATTGRRIGRICVSSFSIWTTVKRWPQQVWGWLTGQDNTSDEPEVKASISYCGRVYYDDKFPHRKIHFVITKDLPLAKHLIEKEIEFKAAFDMNVEFSEPRVLLVLPTGKIGEGWKLVPSVKPTEIKKEKVDEFANEKWLPRCLFTAKWSGDDPTPTTHDEEIKLIGTKTPNSITVECDSVSFSQPEIGQVKKLEVAQPSASAPFALQRNEESLEVKIRDADIDRVAGELPDWQIVMYKLGIGSQYITDIENKHGDEASRRKAFLRMWIAKDGSAATYKKLCDALILLNLKGAAETISSIAQQQFLL